MLEMQLADREGVHPGEPLALLLADTGRYRQSPRPSRREGADRRHKEQAGPDKNPVRAPRQPPHLDLWLP